MICLLAETSRAEDKRGEEKRGEGNAASLSVSNLSNLLLYLVSLYNSFTVSHSLSLTLFTLSLSHSLSPSFFLSLTLSLFLSLFLRQGAEADGKMSNNIQKLQRFRQFYVMVAAYIYFTRIVVFLLAATIPFYYLWLGQMSTELATLIFFVVTGYKFRPAIDNPYLPARSEEAESGEYGLDEEEETIMLAQVPGPPRAVQMQTPRQSRVE
jgi:Lung seven transmembrane receptor